MVRWIYATLVRKIGPGVIPWLRALGLSEPPDLRFHLAGAADFMEVHDRGSDVTVFAFAGMAAQHGGMVNYEFKNLLRKHGGDFNLVFLRDIRCAGYMLTPEDEVGGTPFFAAAVERVMAQLGSRVHVSLGTSAGACAALEFASRCAMDLALAFSPTWPPENYHFPRGWRNRLAQLALLFRRPGTFLELFLLFRTGQSTLRTLIGRLGEGNVVDPFDTYRTFGPPTRTRLYFGADMEADRRSAERFGPLSGVELVPLPTERHNTTGFLKAQGRLGNEIVEQVRAIAHEVLEGGPRSSAPSPLSEETPASAADAS